MWQFGFCQMLQSQITFPTQVPLEVKGSGRFSLISSQQREASKQIAPVHLLGPPHSPTGRGGLTKGPCPAPPLLPLQ